MLGDKIGNEEKDDMMIKENKTKNKLLFFDKQVIGVV